MQRLKSTWTVFGLAMVFCFGILLAGCAKTIETQGSATGLTQEQAENLKAQMQEQLNKADAAANRAEQAAARAESAADRSEAAAKSAQQSANKAEAMADKAESIFMQKMKK